MKKLLFVAFIICPAKFYSQSTPIWLNALGGDIVEGWDGVHQIQTDAEGNVFVCGYFDGVMDVDPSTEFQFIACNSEEASENGYNGFIAKYSANGDVIWANALRSIESSQCRGMVIDDDGNPIVIGTFKGDVDVDPTKTINNLTSNGSFDCFVCKYNGENGNLLWAFGYGNSQGDVNISIARNTNGDFLVSGLFSGPVDFDGGEDESITWSQDEFNNYYMAKYDSDGNYLWAENITNGAGTAAPSRALVFYPNGDYIITGAFYYTSDFDTDDKGEYIITGNPEGYADIFIARYNSNGEFIWARSIAGPSEDVGAAVEIDIDGNIYWCGYFSAEVDLDPGDGEQIVSSNNNSQDLFFSKMDSDGNLVWAKHIGGASDESSSAISLDDLGHLFFGGEYTGDVDIDSGNGDTFLDSGTSINIFIGRYSLDGEFEAVSDFRGQVDTDFASLSDMYVIDDKLYVAGNFNSSLDVDCTNEDWIINSNGVDDIFFGIYAAVPIIEGNSDSTIGCSFNLYPNPASDKLWLQFASNNTPSFDSEVRM